MSEDNNPVEDIQPLTNKRNSIKGSWTIRRRIIVTSLLFCAFCVAYILFHNIDTRVAETIVVCAFGLAGAIIGSYVFGAVYEDTRPENILINRNNNTNNYNNNNYSRSPNLRDL